MNSLTSNMIGLYHNTLRNCMDYVQTSCKIRYFYNDIWLDYIQIHSRLLWIWRSQTCSSPNLVSSNVTRYRLHIFFYKNCIVLGNCYHILIQRCSICENIILHNEAPMHTNAVTTYFQVRNFQNEWSCFNETILEIFTVMILIQIKKLDTMSWYAGK